MKLTFIGAGNIGGAAAAGFARSGRVLPTDITVTARHPSTLEKFIPLGMNVSLDNKASVKDADIVLYAVKPWQMEEVALSTKDSLDYSRQTVVSLAPGVTPEQLKGWLDKDGSLPPVAYAIPNTAIEVCESMTILSSVTAPAQTMKTLEWLFEGVGACITLPVDRMLAGTSLSSCGIAYAMRYMSASARGGLELGLEAEQVPEMVRRTVRGAEALLSDGNRNAEKEIDRVTTPNGMTIRGLNAMEEAGFSDAVIKGLTATSTRKKRLVVKVGSNVLTHPDGSLDTTRVSSIVDQITELRKSGRDVVLVSSGAVACGRSMIREDRTLSEVQQRQLYSAVGQVRLMDLYYKLFSNYGIEIGQVLTMKKNFSSEEEYANQSSCMEVMLRSGVLPIVNENDTVSITELMFTDNDELSGLVAVMVGAEDLILLTNVDGLFEGSPEKEGSRLIRTVRPSDDISEHIDGSRSSSGRGGMASKCKTAAEVAARGIRVMIANGRRDGIITSLMSDPGGTVHTEFIPSTKI